MHALDYTLDYIYNYEKFLAKHLLPRLMQMTLIIATKDD